MIINDAHIHVGQFYERYTSPMELINTTRKLGIAKYAVSSTTICEHNYDKVLTELDYLVSKDFGRAYPVLWLTPELLADEASLYGFIDSGLPWVAIKIHPDLNQGIWLENQSLIKSVLGIAEDRHCPLLIHTSNNIASHIENWRACVKSHPDQIFVFAHCRPTEQTVVMLQQFSNSYADLSFVGKEEMKSLAESGISSKLLWGSDWPITSWFYPEQEMNIYYKERLDEVNNNFPESDLSTIMTHNFEKLYKL